MKFKPIHKTTSKLVTGLLLALALYTNTAFGDETLPSPGQEIVAETSENSPDEGNPQGDIPNPIQDNSDDEVFENTDTEENSPGYPSTGSSEIEGQYVEVALSGINNIAPPDNYDGPYGAIIAVSGDTFTLDVNTNELYTGNYLTFSLSYDMDFISFTGYVPGENLLEESVIMNEAGLLEITAAALGPVEHFGTLTFQMQAPPAPIGTFDLQAALFIVSDTVEEEEPIQALPEYQYAVVYGTFIDHADTLPIEAAAEPTMVREKELLILSELLDCISHIDMYPGVFSLDLNGDGKANGEDILLLYDGLAQGTYRNSFAAFMAHPAVSD